MKLAMGDGEATNGTNGGGAASASGPGGIAGSAGSPSSSLRTSARTGGLGPRPLLSIRPSSMKFTVADRTTPVAEPWIVTPPTGGAPRTCAPSSRSRAAAGSSRLSAPRPAGSRTRTRVPTRERRVLRRTGTSWRRRTGQTSGRRMLGSVAAPRRTPRGGRRGGRPK